MIIFKINISLGNKDKQIYSPERTELPGCASANKIKMYILINNIIIKDSIIVIISCE